MNYQSKLPVILMGALLFSLPFVTSCSKSKSNEGSYSSGTPPDEETPTTPTSGTSQKPTEGSLYVYGKISNNGTIYTHRKLASGVDPKWEKPCEVDVDSAAAGDRFIRCLIEVHEGDLYHMGLTMEFSAPDKLKCAYLRVTPFFFERYQVSNGPTSFTENRDKDGALTSVVGAGVSNVDGATVCDHDYTLDEGPNCCMGSYVKTVIQDAAVITDPPTTTVTQGKWGGDRYACLSGPAKGFLPRTKDGFLRTLEYSTKDWKENKELLILAPNDDQINLFSNAYVSNYLNDLTVTPASWTTDGTGNRFYTFECLDAAYEVYGRIELEVREWNLKSELAKLDTGDAESSGTETDSSSDENDIFDWNDYLSVTPTPIVYPGFVL